MSFLCTLTKGVHPKKGTDEICGDGIDENCNGAVDEGCNAYSASANAEAFIYGGGFLNASGSLNALGLLLVPVGAVIAIKDLAQEEVEDLTVS